MKRKDFILIGIILFIIAISFGANYMLNSSDADKIEIYVDNKLYKTYSINANEEINIETDNGYNIVKIHDHGVEVTEASCPDEVCIHSGFITKASESIVCLPNKVNIKIISLNERENEEDVISK